MVSSAPTPCVRRWFGSVAFCVLGPVMALAQAWLLDPAVAPSIYYESPVIGEVAFAPLADGRLIAYGEFSHASGRSATRLARLNANGSADAAYSSPLAENERIAVLAPLRDGRALAVIFAPTTAITPAAPGALGLAGPASPFGIVEPTPVVVMPSLGVPEVTRAAPSTIVRLLADGRRDPSFTPLACDGLPRLTPLTDGRVVAWGSFRTIGSAARNSLARFDATGALEPNFAPSVSTRPVFFTAVAPAPGGGLVVSAYTFETSSSTTYIFRRLDGAGAIDTRFAPGPVNGTFSLLAAQADGGVLAGNYTLFRYGPTGALDQSFSLQIPSLKSLSRVAPLADGRLIVEAAVGPANSYGTPAVFVVTAAGRVETDLRTLPGALNSQRLLAVLADGGLLLLQGNTVVVAANTTVPASVPGETVTANTLPTSSTTSAGSTSTSIIGVPVFVVPYLAETSLGIRPAGGNAIVSFAPELTRRLTASVSRIRTDAAGRAVVSGFFTHIDGLPRPGLARFNADGTLDRAFAPSAAASLLLVPPTGGPIVQTSGRIARLRDDGSIDPTFAIPSELAGGDIKFLAAAPDGRLLVSVFEGNPRTEASLKLIWLGASGQRLATLPTRFGGFGYWAIIAYTTFPAITTGDVATTVGSIDPTSVTTTGAATADVTAVAAAVAASSAASASAAPANGPTVATSTTATNTNTNTGTTGTPTTVVDPATISSVVVAVAVDGGTTPSPTIPPTVPPVAIAPIVPLPPPIDSVYVVPHAISEAQVLADGRVLVTGSFFTTNNVVTPDGLVWLRADGTVEGPPAPSAAISTLPAANSGLSTWRTARPLADGRALLFENEWDTNRRNLRTTVLRTDSTGQTTRLLSLTNYFAAQFVEVFADGAFLLGGQLYNRDGVPDANFVPMAFNGTTATNVYAAARFGNRLWAGGSFDRIGGQTRTALARFETREVVGITHGPLSQSVVTGRDATFSVVLGTNQSASVQWYFNGVAIPGSTGATLRVLDTAAGHAGSYHAVVTIAGQTFSSAPATLTLERNTSQLINFSARSLVTPGAPQVAGFVVAGSAPREVFLRATGRGLPVTGAATTGTTTSGAPLFIPIRTLTFASWILPVPVLTVHGAGGPLATDRGSATTTTMATRAREVGAFALRTYSDAPATTVYGSAIAPSLAPGAYTAVTTSGDGADGESLFELYDVARGGNTQPLLRNVAIRARIAGGKLAGGFVISGNGPRRVLVRGIGPALTNFGIADAVRDPELRLLANESGAVIALNTGWSADPALSAAAARTGAFPLSPQSRDTALVIHLEPGSYTAELTSATRATGTAMIELYVVED